MIDAGAANARAKLGGNARQTARSRVGRIWIQIDNLVVVLGERPQDVPTQTKIDRKFGRHFDVVLDVGRQGQVSQLQLVSKRTVCVVNLTQQEAGE